MSIKNYLLEQIDRHPSMMPQDVIKHCYQAAFGAEHLLSDISAAKKYFDYELETVEARDGELYEMISDDICRVNLGVVKARELDSDTVFNAFAASARINNNGRGEFLNFLSEAEDVVLSGRYNFKVDEWKSFLEKYKDACMPAVHHSERYRDAEKPSYRIVNRKILNV